MREKSPPDQPSSKTMSSCFPAKPAPRASAAPQRLAKTSRGIPPALAAVILAPVSSARSAVDVIAAAVDAQTVVADVPTAVAIVADVPAAARDSNADPAVPAVRVTIVVIGIPVRRAVRSSSAKC